MCRGSFCCWIRKRRYRCKSLATCAHDAERDIILQRRLHVTWDALLEEMIVGSCCSSAALGSERVYMDDAVLHSQAFECGQVSGAFEHAEIERSMPWSSAALESEGVRLDDAVLRSH